MKHTTKCFYPIPLWCGVYRLLLSGILFLTILVGCGGGGGGGDDDGGNGDGTTAGTWAKTYGGTGDDWPYSIQQTSDGGYIVTGLTNSFGAGSDDFWVLKLNSDGTVAWEKTYGGTGVDWAYSIQQTDDDGYIVAGYTNSFGAGSADFWVFKLDGNGTVTWQKTYGGTGVDRAHSIQQTSDGGYIVAGETWSSGAGNSDFWVLKLNSDGTVAWQKTYGGLSYDMAYSIQQTSDGGYIVAGYTYSSGAGLSDFWVLKLYGNGTVEWQKTYGGTGEDWAYSIQQTSDGGYIVAGYTNSFGASYDFWVLKLNSSGTVTWQKTYGGSFDEGVYSIRQTSDGGYIVAGYTDSSGAGLTDFWVLKLNSSGTVTWQKTYGGSGDDGAFSDSLFYATSIQQTIDGGYIVTGVTFSFGTGNSDFWVLKLSSSGSIAFNPASGASTYNTSTIVNSPPLTSFNSSASVTTPSVTTADTLVTPQGTWATIQTQAP